MSSKPISPVLGALIMGGFVLVAVVVLFTVRGVLKAQPESSHGSHYKWAAEHKAETASVEPASKKVLADGATVRPGAKVRTLDEFYSRRAYAGAPPIIPHAVDDDGVINDDCLSCHEKGGFVPEYNAYTPVTPHPEMENCRQCHVESTVEGTFVESEWVESTFPVRGHQAIAGGPLTIPHSLQFRENCQACHTGPQAVNEIRTSHPERENCQQCHVLDRDIPTFKSKIDMRQEGSNVEK